MKKDEARKKVLALSEKYGLEVDPDAKIEDITVGMQQRTEILKMLYRDNEVLIFDEPTAVLTPQEIQELMTIMKNLAAEGKSCRPLQCPSKRKIHRNRRYQRHHTGKIICDDGRS